MPRLRGCAVLRAVLPALVATALAHPVEAQWFVSVGVRAPRYSGGAYQQTTDRWLGPYRPTMWEVGVERSRDRLSLGLRFRYAPSSLALEGSEAVVVVKDALTVYGIDPELSLRVTTLGSGIALRVVAGPVLDLWKLPEVGSHLRIGATAGLGLDLPLGERFSGMIRVSGAVTGSPFDAEDLEVGTEPRALWRRDASAVLRYRL